MTDFTYDEEVFANYFSAGFTNTDTDEYYYFEISDRRNDLAQLRNFCNWMQVSGHRGVGFNNVGFDYPILHLILTNPHVTVQMIFEKCNAIINNNARFNPHVIWERDTLIQQIDLLKLNHYDNVNKRCSLKQLEFAMRMENIIDLPFTPGSTLDDNAKNVTAAYLQHDVKATTMFYRENKKAIELRERLSDTYGVDMLNFSDSSIGSHILVTKLNQAGIQTHEYRDEWDEKTQSIKSKKKARGTPRDSINLGSVLLPNVRVERPEFQAVINWLHKKNIKETKGALSGIPYDEELFQYMDPHSVLIPNLTIEDTHGMYKPVKGRKTRLSSLYAAGVLLDLSKFPGVCTSSVPGQKGNLNVMVEGVRYDFGTGGIHASVESQILKSDEEYVILDYDFASYYPHLSFRNRIYPEHLGEEFCDIYEGMYQDRKAIPKSDPNNYALKIALNGSYGNSNSQYSPFYDPRFTMTITMNGQMYLCMLAEQFLKVPDTIVVQVNTDGVTVRTPRKYHDHIRSVVKWIEAVTNIDMEEAIYSQMNIMNVNNYQAVYACYRYFYEGQWYHEKWFKENDIKTKGLPCEEIIGDFTGKVKRKSAYAWKTKFHDKDDIDLAWHQNHSELIIPMAAEAALVRNEDIATFIKSHRDIYDFMIMAKVNRTDKLFIGEEEIQRISRVYASKSGGRLWKRMPPLKGKTTPRDNDMFKGTNFRAANDINDASFDDIDYDYYIEEAEKLVKPLLK